MTSAWWWFAFFSVPKEVPAWLISARNACFGMTENGLPDASGWIILVLAPLLLLFALSMIWFDELQSNFRNILRSKRGVYLILLVLLLSGVQANEFHSKIKAGTSLASLNFSSDITFDFPSDYPELNEIAPNFTLIDHKGNSISLWDEAKKKPLTILSFIFADCKTVCPAIISQLKEALSQLNTEEVELILITLDPWRDTPRALPQIAKNLSINSNSRLLSGKVPYVLSVLREFNVPIQRDLSNGNIDHPALIYFISSDSKIIFQMGNVPAHWIVQAALRVIDRSTGSQ